MLRRRVTSLRSGSKVVACNSFFAGQANNSVSERFATLYKSRTDRPTALPFLRYSFGSKYILGSTRTAWCIFINKLRVYQGTFGKFYYSK